jgi:2-octaprenyl-6-methoxyphenol hydroxylase
MPATLARKRTLDNGMRLANVTGMASDRNIVCDALIVGGGMAGLTQGLALANAGLHAVVVDRAAPGTLTTAEHDGRVSSIAYGSHAMWDRLGVWRYMANEAEPILEIRVSDGDMPFFLHFDHREVGDRPFGFMVENRHIRTALYRGVSEAAGLDLLAPAEVAEIEFGTGMAECRLTDGRSIRAPLVIGAEGRTSPLREQAGIRLLKWDYGQDAIVCTVEHELPHHGIAKEHFLPAGPFALLPMRGHRSSLVWTEKRADAPAMLALPEAEFDAEIMARAGDHWGRIHCDSRRWRYPLGLQNAERYIDRRLALIGDAAHAMHPIAGQGLNLGLRDVAALSEVVVEAARLGLDHGGGEALKRYQEWRRFDALTMLLMTDGLNRLFSTDIGPVRLARSLGLGAVNTLPPLKKFFERHAAAMSGDLPRLIRGEAI